jgi:tRNA G46 methylase TrmB
MTSRFEDSVSKYYNESYSQIFSQGSVGTLWRYIHRKMEKPFDKSENHVILEVGSGAGEHLKLVRCNYLQYYATDIAPPQLL